MDFVDLAKKALAERKLDLAHQESLKALGATEHSYDALLVAGDVATARGDVANAEAHFREASTLKPDDMHAFEGLATVQMASHKLEQAAQSYSHLLDMARKKSAIEKQREFLWRSAEAEERLGNLDSAQEHLQTLLKMPLESDEQRLEALCFLADVQTKLETELQLSRVRVREIHRQHSGTGKMKTTPSKLKLAVDAERCNEQLAETGSLATTLNHIVHKTTPNPHYARYFERHLQIYLSRLGVFPPRSQLRQDARMMALKECTRMVTTSAGGCTSSFPFEAAIWLLEEQEELYGSTFAVRSDASNTLNLRNGHQAEPPRKDRMLQRISSRRSLSQLSLSSLNLQPQPEQTRLKWFRGNSILRLSEDRLNIRRVVDETIGEGEAKNETVATQHESFGMKLAHQFPWLGSAQVAVSLALRRRFLSDPDAPSLGVRRKQITTGLLRGMQSGADSAAGWKALAELQYQNRQYKAALDSACSGLEWHATRRASGHESLNGFALSLRLCSARSLRRLGRLNEAEEAFKSLAGWCTEGESGFDELSGSTPTSIRQQALRGLAKIAIMRHDTPQAKHTYERILGKALMGRGRPAEHWAYAEYAWLQFEDKDYENARVNLEKALDEASKEGCGVTESEVAEHHYKLGRILWDLGGTHKTNPKKCRFHLEQASLEESDSQGQACLWLGRWFQEVGGELDKAKKCLEEALVIDPKNREIAQTLRQVNQGMGRTSEADALEHLTTLTETSQKSEQTSAFANASLPAFSKQPSGEHAAARIVADIAERVSSGKVPLALQSAHSANSELAAYTNVKRGVRSLSRAEKDVLSKAKRK